MLYIDVMRVASSRKSEPIRPVERPRISFHLTKRMRTRQPAVAAVFAWIRPVTL